MTQAQLAAGGRAASTRTSWRSCRRSSQAAQKNVAANQAEGRRAAGEAGRRRQRGCSARQLDYQYAKATYDQDRYDFEASRAAGASSAASEGQKRVEERSEAAERAEPRRWRRPTAEQGRDPDSSSASTPARSATIAEADRGDERRADAAAASGSTSIAPSVVEGLLPQRAAARLHGADAQGAADHPAERRRRRELHPRAEDGSVPDLPPGDRQEGLREVPAAVHDAPESRRRTSAAARRIRSTSRLHGLPRGHGAVGQLPRRGAHAGEREAEGRVGRRSTTGKSRTCGTTRCCRRR